MDKDSDILSDLQGEIEDIKDALRDIGDDLRCAESCETIVDFHANVKSAREVLSQQVDALRVIENMSAKRLAKSK